MAACIALITAPVAAAQQPTTEPSEVEAAAALDAAEEALTGAPEPAAADATVVMNELAASLPALEGSDRRRARGLLARPTDANDQYGDSYPPAAPVASAESAHFCVFWVNAPGFEDAPNLLDIDGRTDGDGVPDYVESILEMAELSYAVEVKPGKLGWAPPKPDKQGCGADPSARADVYLKQIGNLGLFGYESPDPGQGPKRSQYGYLVLDNDYAASEFGVYPDPLAPAKVTFAHEFNHLLQQNYDSFQDVWMFESVATWSEDHVYPDINDYVNFVPSFARRPNTPITERAAAAGLKIYGSAVWNHWLASGGGGYGTDVVRRAWQVSDKTDPADLATAAYDKAIRKEGGKGFSRDFVRFAAATAEWRAGLGRFRDGDAYPDMNRSGKLSRGANKKVKLDHTAYRLIDVRPASDLRLTVETDRGVRAGIALVAREGGEATGKAVSHSRWLGDDGKATVSLHSAKGYERVTAVIVNADGRVSGVDIGQWTYAKDNHRFDVKLR